MTLSVSWVRRLAACFAVCVALCQTAAVSAYAQDSSGTTVVRVGYFEFEGYHELDEYGRRSGYGYEYLHEMAKYTGWVFEYVDGTWNECQQMLEAGEIDLLTSAQYTQERDEKFDFSKETMGTSYAQLTVADGDNRYGRNDFSSFTGIVVGLLNGNSRNESLAKFAAEEGFSYRAVMFDTQDELDAALQSKAVDAILTSSLRKLKNERIIAQFAPSPFYAIVDGGDTELLDEVNYALECIEMNTPAYKYNLYQEHYRGHSADTFVLSKEEEAYLASQPVVRAVVRSGMAPLSSWENSHFEGIVADIFAYLCEGSDIKVEYICTDSLEQSFQMLADGCAEIVCLFESDFNLAEQYHTWITSPYLNVNYSALTPKKLSAAIKTIAICQQDLFGKRYAEARYPDAALLPLPTTDDAVNAVSCGQADMALVNTYSAEKSLLQFPNLRASLITDDDQQFSVAVSQKASPHLYSLLDKKINVMSSESVSKILSEHTMFYQPPFDLLNYCRQNPMQVILIATLVFAVIISVLLYIIFLNKKHAKKIHSLAYVDEQTGLWNDNGFMQQGQALLDKSPAQTFVVIDVDLSNFASVNETYGRTTGDHVIMSMGNALTQFANEHTVVAHSSADHFSILLGYKSMGELHETLSKLKDNLSQHTVGDLTLPFGVCMGIGLVKGQQDSLLRALDQARTAHHQCDEAHPIVFMDAALQSRLLRQKQIRDHVSDALLNDEFLVYYQPKVNMVTHRIYGAEALVRWNHGALGFLAPNEFIPICEQEGLITEIDFFVLEQVCKLARAWLDNGRELRILSINQSRSNFFKVDYLDRLREVREKYQIPPNCIELEITETLFGQEAITNEIIRQIKSLGFLVSMDDFGSGYSSLCLLHQISVDILKIDKKLLDESDKEDKMKKIIQRIVQIATDLSISVVCEGVETQAQADFLLGVNCKHAQGFLFSKPLPQAEFEAVIAADGELR